MSWNWQELLVAVASVIVGWLAKVLHTTLTTKE